MVGKVITFYSYKGGVGRSMAMANIGVILAQWGYKTLLIDWDLEAPGLEHFFKTHINIERAKKKLGLIDLFDLKQKDKDINLLNLNWEDFITKIPINNNLDFLSAGKRDEEYISKLNAFDFNLFYDKYNGGQYLEDLREIWISKYQFILIDSRTGLTDSSGVCSIQMPDILILIFTLNNQSFDGIKNVAQKAINGQKQIVFDRFRLRILPIPSRIENAETFLMDEWMAKIDIESEGMLDWLPRYNESPNKYLLNPLQLINQIKIPYKTLYAYGERLAVTERGTSDPHDLGYVYETISAVIANDLQHIDLLSDSRDTFIKKAKGESVTEDKSLLDKVAFEKQNLETKLLLNEQLLIINKQKLYKISQISVLIFFVLFTLVSYYFFKTKAVEKSNSTIDSILIRQSTLRQLEDKSDSTYKKSINESDNRRSNEISKKLDKNRDKKHLDLKRNLEAYAYVGIYYDGKWIEKNFTFDNNDSLPKTGSIIKANIAVNARAGIIEYNEGKGWQNKEVVGAIMLGDKIKVDSVYGVAGGSFIWVKFKKFLNTNKK
ncbi:tyrosine-protein kinase family protein [Spirosoma arboris]|uniref:tyrosine-protein kinase family protein n=1 Tax=Spirosoma arboris TaxID=2682092 RepID=UPI0012FA0B0F|nr:AAA family ATPase [Spirosoma arboris]